jgi:hypothetical protein
MRMRLHSAWGVKSSWPLCFERPDDLAGELGHMHGREGDAGMMVACFAEGNAADNYGLTRIWPL